MSRFRAAVLLAGALVLCGLTVPSQAAQTSGAQIAGRVVDAQTALPLAGAFVALVGSTESAETDAAGEFRFPDLEPGTYRVRIARTGYQPAVSDPVILVSGQTQKITIAIQSAPTGASLKVIGSTSVKAGSSLQRSSTTYRTINPEALVRAGIERGGDAIRLLPAIVNTDRNNAATAGDLHLNIRGIGPLETTAMLDGHPIAYGIPFGYNYTLSPLSDLRNISVTYGSGSNVVGVSAIGGIIDFQTLDPTPDNRVAFSQGYGTWDKAAAVLQATGTINRFGYALSYGVNSSDGPLHQNDQYQPGAAFDQSAPPGSPVYNLGTYKQDGTDVERTGLFKLRYDVSPISKVTFTAAGSSIWNDKTGNTDLEYTDYAPALAFGNLLLARYSPANFPKLPACPSGTFVATNANGMPNGFGPNGQPDGGQTCQTPQQYAAFNTGWDGVGPAWQTYNFNDYHVGFEAAPHNRDIRFDAYTNRYLNIISRQDALPFISQPGNSPQAFLGDEQVVEGGATADETFLGENNDVGAGIAYLNVAYRQQVASPYFKSLGTPIAHQVNYLLHDAYHPQRAPLTAYGDLTVGRSSATNTSYADPRATLVYSFTHNDAVRVSAGATTTQPSGDEIDQPFLPTPPSASGAALTCSSINSIGSAPSTLLKPERGVDEEFAYGHRFPPSSLVQLTAYNVNVYDKLYQTVQPLSQTGSGFIDPAYLAAQSAAIQAKCGAAGASLLGLKGTFNVGQMRARGLMLSGRQYIARRTFVDYDWSLDSTVLVSAPAPLLQANLTIVPGSQLPKLPLHTFDASLDHTFNGGIDARYTLHALSANNPNALPAYNYSDLVFTVPSGPGAFSLAVSNLFNQNAFIEGLRYEGVPLALNQYATSSSYAQYTGAGATERFGLPYRALYVNYSVQVR
ncbi:MAG TPA: TonB-dependent receptor [Candidatus Baltobacteraceae bacterium]|nr:TonB-dependent receptor [Candidatus Baltobacteraceae bacterium]